MFLDLRIHSGCDSSNGKPMQWINEPVLTSVRAPRTPRLLTLSAPSRQPSPIVPITLILQDPAQERLVSSALLSFLSRLSSPSARAPGAPLGAVTDTWRIVLIWR